MKNLGFGLHSDFVQTIMTRFYQSVSFDRLL
jgi:hypothetical protein